MANVEKIRFGGVLFRRYPDSPNHSERSYHVPGVADKKRGVRRLHEEIWIAANGPIPSDHDIHHVDGNSLNNNLSNLQAITKSDHQRLHTEERRSQGLYSTPARLAHLDRIRPLSKEWHASEAGRAWHADHGQKTWEGRKTFALTCQHCGTEYQSKARERSKFCSGNCRTKARYAAGADNVERTCVICNVRFSINRHQPAVSCSRQCGRKWREIKKQLNS